MFWINLGTKKWASWLQAAGNNATNEYKPNRIIFLNSSWVYFSIRISSKRRIENFFVEPLVKSKLIPKWTGMPKWTISSLSWIAIQRKVDGFGRKWTLIGHKKMITECGWPINSKVDGLFYFSIAWGDSYGNLMVPSERERSCVLKQTVIDDWHIFFERIS